MKKVSKNKKLKPGLVLMNYYDGYTARAICDFVRDDEKCTLNDCYNTMIRGGALYDLSVLNEDEKSGTFYRYYLMGWVETGKTEGYI